MLSVSTAAGVLLLLGSSPWIELGNIYIVYKHMHMYMCIYFSINLTVFLKSKSPY